jgi:hypothetical protein
MLWIRLGFTAELDSAFCLNPDPGSETNRDPCRSGYGSWSDFASQRVEFFMKNIVYGRVTSHTNYLHRYKSLYKRLDHDIFC